PSQSKVLVCEGRYGSIAIEYRGHALRWQEIPAAAQPRVPKERVDPRKKGVPPPNHPWREPARRAVKEREMRMARMAASQPALAWHAPPFGLRRAALRDQANSSRKTRML